MEFPPETSAVKLHDCVMKGHVLEGAFLSVREWGRMMASKQRTSSFRQSLLWFCFLLVTAFSVQFYVQTILINKFVMGAFVAVCLEGGASAVSIALVLFSPALDVATRFALTDAPIKEPASHSIGTQSSKVRLTQTVALKLIN